MSSTKKNYIGGGARQVTFADGGSVINLDLRLEDLNNLPVSERGYIRLVLAQRQSVDQYGNSHYVYENTFVPDKSKGTGGGAPASSGPKKPSVSGPAKYNGGGKAPF